MAPSLLYPEGWCQSLKGKIELLLERADDNLESIQLLIDNGLMSFENEILSFLIHAQYMYIEFDESICSGSPNF